MKKNDCFSMKSTVCALCKHLHKIEIKSEKDYLHMKKHRICAYSQLSIDILGVYFESEQLQSRGKIGTCFVVAYYQYAQVFVKDGYYFTYFFKTFFGDTTKVCHLTEKYIV